MSQNDLQVMKIRSRRRLPATTCKNIIKRKAERASINAGNSLSVVLEQFALEIGSIAVNQMRLDGRSTLNEKHIVEACEIFDKFFQSNGLLFKRG